MKLGLAGHDYTYGFYGNEEAKPNSFGSVSWETKDTVPNGAASSLSKVTTQDFNNQGESNVTLGEGQTLSFELLHEQDQAGDGTVPLVSGAALKQLIPPPKQAFAISGVEHQKGFDNEFALRATLYGIVSLAQLAPDPSA